MGEGNKAEAVRLMQELELHSLIARFGLSDITPAADRKERRQSLCRKPKLPLCPLSRRAITSWPRGPLSWASRASASWSCSPPRGMPCRTRPSSRWNPKICSACWTTNASPLPSSTARRSRPRHGCGGWGSSIVWDGKLAAYLLDASASKYNLSELIISYRADAAFTCEKWPDAGALADLFAKMKSEITALDEDSLYNDIEFPLAQVLADMTRIGILVDKEGIEKFGVKMRSELEDVLTRIHMETGSASFNPNSPKQLGEMLFDTMGLPHGKKDPARLVYRRRDAGSPAGLPAGGGYSAVPRLPEAELHLRRGPAEGHRGGWPHPHPLQPDRSPHRTAFLRQPQPAEHPHPHRAGQPAPRLLCGAARLRAGGRDYSQIELRILAHVTGDEHTAAGLPHRRGHPPQHCRQDLPVCPSSRSRPACALRQKPSTSASCTARALTASRRTSA